MRILTSTIVTLAFAIGGCASTSKTQSIDAALQTDASAIAYLETMNDWQPKSTMTDESVWNALTSSEKSLFIISFDSIETTKDDVYAQNLKIALSSLPDIGLKIEEARMWGFDEGTLSALQTNKPTLIADRIDLKNISYFGFDELLKSFAKSSNKATIELVEGLVEEEVDTSDLEIELNQSLSTGKFEANYARITLDGIHWNGLSNSVPAKASETKNTKELWDFFSEYARWNNAFSVDAILAEDTFAEFDMIQNINADASQSMHMRYKMPLWGMLKLDKGHWPFSVYKDMEVYIDQNIQDTTLPSGSFELDQGGKTGLLTIRDFDVSGLMNLLANRTVPTLQDENIVSLGKWHGEDMTNVVGDQTISYTKEMDFDLSQFHSFIPTRISYSVPEMTYDLTAFGDMVTKMIADTGAFEAEDFDQETFEEYFSQGMTILNQFDLERLNLGAKFQYDWNPKDGEIDLNLNYAFQDLIGIELEYDGAIGTLEAFKTAFTNEDKPFDFDSLGDIFDKEGAVDGVRLKITDDNVGLGRLFGLAIELSKLVPEEEAGELAMLQSQTPDNLRLMASSMIRMAGMGMNEKMPPAVGYTNLIADFIQKGGDIELTVSPDQRINKANTRAAKDAGMKTPEQVIDYIGLEVTHTAPPEE